VRERVDATLIELISAFPSMVRSGERPAIKALSACSRSGQPRSAVAALAYGVGIVIARVVFDIPVLAPERDDGALGDSTTCSSR
jgi:hypothetical protein